MTFFSSRAEVLREAYVNRHEPEHFRVLTDIYWRAVLFVTAFTVLLAVFYGLWELIIIIRGPSEKQDSPVVTAPTPSLINPAELEETLNSFAERSSNYEFLKENPPRIADPSR